MTTVAGAQYMSLPAELRALPQWCVAGPDKSPYKAGSNGKLYHASNVVGPWHDFETACQLAEQFGGGIGFILTPQDPFTCIDLDIKDSTSIDKNGVPVPPDKWTPELHLRNFEQLIGMFSSYTEMSTSGKGAHIWVKGQVQSGTRRFGVEIYSDSRFMICTGNAVGAIQYHISDDYVISASVVDAQPKPVEVAQELIDKLAATLTDGRDIKAELEEIEAIHSDAEIIDMAMNAANGEKFNDLCAGEWQKYNYPSQSEADLSLMSMFTFYSKSNEQCRRLFRMSMLGKREKAIKDDRYLNFTLRIIRGRQQREESAEIHLDLQAVEELGRIRQREAAAEQQVDIQIPAAQPPYSEPPSSPPLPVAPSPGSLPWPPGLAGEIAKFIYNSSPRPVKEVAIVATMGLLAGVCGKVFTLPQSGLNIYMILVARSAIGKEAMHSGVSLLLDKLRNSVPSAQNFVDFSEFVSGPALVKACAANPSFVNVAGEWGRKLKRLAHEDRGDGPMQQLRTTMTNLYQKSGPSSIVGGLNYSNKDQNIAAVNGVAYSMIGETTPETFYNALTETMMEDGFLSRFNIIEYRGERPPANKNPIYVPNEQLTEALCGLVTQALTLLSRYQYSPVEFDPTSRAMLDAFDRECDLQINSTEDEGWRQMWNRAHLKASRIAGLLAVADNYVRPTIYAHHVEWALDLIRRDIAIMSRRIDEGDVGLGDNSRERKILALIKEYCTKPIADSYRIPKEMQVHGVIPRKYIQIRIARSAAFTQHRLGASGALDNAIRSLIDNGYIMELDKAKVVELYGPQGRSFRVLHIPDPSHSKKS